MDRKAARNMQSSNINKVEIQCICWFYSEGITKLFTYLLNQVAN